MYVLPQSSSFIVIYLLSSVQWFKLVWFYLLLTNVFIFYFPTRCNLCSQTLIHKYQCRTSMCDAAMPSHCCRLSMSHPLVAWMTPKNKLLFHTMWHEIRPVPISTCWRYRAVMVLGGPCYHMTDCPLTPVKITSHQTVRAAPPTPPYEWTTIQS